MAKIQVNRLSRGKTRTSQSSGVRMKPTMTTWTKHWKKPFLQAIPFLLKLDPHA